MSKIVKSLVAEVSMVSLLFFAHMRNPSLYMSLFFIYALYCCFDLHEDFSEN